MVFEFLKETDKPQNQVEPSFTEVLNQAQKSFGLGMRASCPAEIISYDLEKQTVRVRPQLKGKGTDGKFVEAPEIYEVPVAFPRAGSSIVAMPIAKGDNVMLVFQDRSLEKWKETGGQVENDDDRAHDLTDAVAYPGMYPKNKAMKLANSTDIIIINDKEKDGLEVRIKPNGHLQFINSENELISVLSEMLATLREAVVYTSTGRQKLRHSNFEKVHNKLKTFLEK